MKAACGFVVCGSGCNSSTDITCVVCNIWFCEVCLKNCLQCEQPVCKKCYKEDLCCLVRPWGEKTEQHFRVFYHQGMFVADGNGLYWVETFLRDGERNGSKWSGVRKEVLRRSVLHTIVERFDPYALPYSSSAVAEVFPRITKYLQNDDTRLKMISFLEQAALYRKFQFVGILLNSEDQDEILSLLNEKILESHDIRKRLIECSLGVGGIHLFECLKRRGLLDWNVLQGAFVNVTHVEGLKWIQSNGVDVLKDRTHFSNLMRFSPAPVMEYLIIERGMTTEYMCENRHINFEIAKLVYRIKGMEDIRKIHFTKFMFDLNLVRFLRSIGYLFEKKLILEQRYRDFENYCFVCFGVLTYKDLSKARRKDFNDFVSDRDIKICKQMIPFMTDIRKRKIMIMLLCMKKVVPRLQKEIVWTILDYAYSPVNERG